MKPHDTNVCDKELNHGGAEECNSEQRNRDDSLALAPTSIDYDQEQRVTKTLLSKVANNELTYSERRLIGAALLGAHPRER